VRPYCVVVTRRLSVALAALALLAGCSAPAAPVSAPATSSGPQTTTSQAGPPTITLDFAGDVHFAERTLKLLDNPTTAFGPVATILKQADVAMVNLETSVTTRGTAEPKQFHFRAPATAYGAVAAAGVDLVTIANNHAMDYGRVGLDDTINSAKAASMPFVGAGQNATEAYAPWITTVKGVKIAFIGLSQVSELASTWSATETRSGIAMAYDVNRSVAAVKAAKAQADVVVVYLHWGQEYNNCPTSQQKSIASALSAAGATLLVGTHAHVLLGDGWMGKTFVSYGLSNFVWWYNDAGSNDTGVLRVTLTGSTITKTEFLPAYIDRVTGQPIPSTGAEASRISAEQAALRPCTGLTSAPS
jgi:poly-gamma-glutamate capsule biosynthesis protein CapA/YwtB (metallophosphatase superfamily)